MKNIAILGSTGSIGTQTLEVARNLKLKIKALAANSSIELLEIQAREFMPEIVAVRDETLAKKLKLQLFDTNIKVVSGIDGLIEAATIDDMDTVVTSIVGTAGLVPTVEAIKARKNIALANKETLVAAGGVVMPLAKEYGVNILPVDSEHAAVFQCIMGNKSSDVDKIILTASGGPFRGRTTKELEGIAPAEALKHPNWIMGSKITIDSATLMNKGLEVIEACWLFGVDSRKVEVVVHPQSIIHSMVQFVDGSIMAQLGSPDMRIPIQFALTWPERKYADFKRIDFLKTASLTFEPPDMETFTCLKLAYEAIAKGGTLPAAMNAANEIAVEQFLSGILSFLKIPEVIKRVMDEHHIVYNYKIDDVLCADAWARQRTKEVIGNYIC